jgi:hypothetical protein
VGGSHGRLLLHTKFRENPSLVPNFEGNHTTHLLNIAWFYLKHEIKLKEDII